MLKLKKPDKSGNKDDLSYRLGESLYSDVLKYYGF